MVVDRLRSCYRSRWNFEGYGDIIGQYYFVPDYIPSWPEPHFWTSRNWVDGNPIPTPEYGESRVAEQAWVNGLIPTEYLCDCEAYSPVARRYQLDITGIAAGTCLFCPVLNQVVVLEPIAPCVWQSGPFNLGPCGTSWRWRLVMGGVIGPIRLFLAGIGSLPTIKGEWLNDGIGFDPLLPFTVYWDVTSETSLCSSWPSSIVVTPLLIP